MRFFKKNYRSRFFVFLKYLLLAFSFTIIGCAHKDKQVKVEVPDPFVKYHHMDIKDLDFSGGELSLFFEVKLPESKSDIECFANDYTFKFSGNKSIHKEEGDLFTVSGNKLTKFSITVDFSFGENFESKKKILEKGKTYYRFSGNLTCSLPGEDLDLPIASKGAFLLPQMPIASVMTAQLARYGLHEGNLTFEISIENKNHFPVRIKFFEYKIFIDEKELAVGEIAVNEKIPSVSNSVYEESIAINKDTLGKDVKKILTEGVINYKLDGKLSFDEFNIPIEEFGEVNIDS